MGSTHEERQLLHEWMKRDKHRERGQAYIIVYNGQVYPRPKHAHWGYLGFRAVK
jgi:hypothetical protein